MDMPSPEQPPDAAGIVIVASGGDAGAAVIYPPSELVGAEIEIRAVGTEWDGSHTGVHERHGPGITTTAAVFGSLRAGRYEMRIKDAAGTEHPAPVVVEPAQVPWGPWAGATPAGSQASERSAWSPPPGPRLSANGTVAGVNDLHFLEQPTPGWA